MGHGCMPHRSNDVQEKLRRMTPEQREKYEQRKAKVETGRMQRKYTRKG